LFPPSARAALGWGTGVGVRRGTACPKFGAVLVPPPRPR